MENLAPNRTVSVAEAAEMTGLSKVAVQRRIDRGTIRATLRDGRRRIPVSELRRAGLVDVSGAPVHDTGDDAEPRGRFRGSTGVNTGAAPQVVIDVNAVLARVETLASDLAHHRLLTAQAESLAATEASAREAAEAALHEVRAELTATQARLQDLEARIPDPPADKPAEPPPLVLDVATPAPAPRPWWAFWQPKPATGADAGADGPIQPT